MKVHNLLVTGSLTSGGENIGSISSSVATTNNAQDGRLTSLESTTGSIISKTGSYSTTGSNVFIGIQTMSGSIIPAVNNTYDLGSPTQQFRHVYISSGSLYVNGTKVLGSTAQELQITTDAGQSFKILESGSDTITLQSNDGNITLATSGGGDVILDPTTGVIALKGTTTIYAGNRILSSDGNNIHFGNGVTISGSLLATGTNIISGSQQISDFGYTTTSSVSTISSSINTRIDSIANIQATTGSNNFIGTQTITGSLFISQNLVVQGSSSLQNITASAVNIGANIVNLNTANPAIRFAGLNIFDSGSIGGSGSFLYDAVEDEFIFVHRGDNSNITSSVVLMGPQTYNNVGNEIYPTNNRILKSTGNEHVGDSIISETGGGIGINGSLSITGSIVATGTSLVSGSAQITYSGLTGIPSGIISGSAQLNTFGFATTGSNTFIGTESVSGSLSTIGRVKITTKLASAASPDAAGDYYIALNNPTHNDTGSLLMADNGNVWLNSAGNKTLWLNWYGMSNAVSKSDVRIGDGYGGTEILAVYGSARRVDINGSANITGSLNTSGVVTVGSTLIANTGTGAIFRAIYNGDNIVEIGNYNVANGYRDVDIAASRLRFYTSTAGAANGTLALTLGTNQLATFSGDIVLSKGVDPKISSGTGIGLNIDGAALYLNRYSQSNIVMVPNGGQVGIGDSPSYTLHVKKNVNQVAGFESPNANTWIDLISTSGNWSLGASNTDTSSFGVYQRVAGGTAVNKEYLNVNSSGNLGVNLQGSSAGFQITSPDYDGYEVTTWVGTTPSIIRYAGSNRFNIINSGSYSGLRTQSSRWRYMRIEADIKSSNADHYGFFWSSSQTTLGADSNAGYKWVFQPSSNTINIRDINGNGDQAVSAAVPFEEKDGNWHHYVTELSHDGRVKIWVDGVLYHNRYGYNPGFGYCGILNFTGTLEVSNFTITSSETVVQDVAFFAYHNGPDVNYVNTTLPYQNELYDYGGGYNTNGVYTAPVAGMYMFSATCNAYAGGSYPNTVPRAYWQINNADIGNSIHFRGNDLAGSATSGLTQRSATVVLYLNYGDTVRIQVKDGQFDLFGANHFCGYLLK
jgi:hypothetical protein